MNECEAVIEKVKKCDCGGIIETHQGDTRDRDEWYCLNCNKEFLENPFNPQDEAKDLFNDL